MVSAKSDMNESVSAEGEKSYDLQAQYVSKVAKPLADRKTAKNIFKLLKKANKRKHIRKGVRDVQKYIRKGEKGLVILAGDTNPIEVFCHLAAVCEEKGIPYCYVPSREALGVACGGKRPTCAVLAKSHSEYEEAYQDCHGKVDRLLSLEGFGGMQ